MSGALIAAAAVRPVWGDADRRVEGPDEDAFTLAVAAIERVSAGAASAFPSGFPEIDLVGEFPAEVETMLSLALGREEIEIRRHPPEPAALGQAIRNASHASGDGAAALVVAVDLARPRDGSGAPGDALAVAGAFGAGPGAAFLGATTRHHPPERRPDASHWIAAARRSAPKATEATHGTLAFAAPAAPPVLLAEWRTAFPNVPAVHVPWTPAGHAGGAAGVLFVALFESARPTAAGGTLWAAALRPERTDFLAFRADAPVSWLGPFERRGTGRPMPTGRGTDGGDRALHAVSQGAYVPRATYLENLPARWRFAAQRCPACGATTFPPRDRCGRCQAVEGLVAVTLPTQGLEVEAVTVVGPGAQPTEFDPWVAAVGPYAVVLARLGPENRATLQLTDSDPTAVRVGARADTVLRRLYAMEGSWRYGRKAVLVADRPAAAIPPA